MRLGELEDHVVTIVDIYGANEPSRNAKQLRTYKHPRSSFRPPRALLLNPWNTRSDQCRSDCVNLLAVIQ
jgi:hypothetical protein